MAAAEVIKYLQKKSIYIKAKLFSKSHTGSKLKKQNNLNNMPEQENYQLWAVYKCVWNKIKVLKLYTVQPWFI